MDKENISSGLKFHQLAEEAREKDYEDKEEEK